MNSYSKEMQRLNEVHEYYHFYLLVFSEVHLSSRHLAGFGWHSFAGTKNRTTFNETIWYKSCRIVQSKNETKLSVSKTLEIILKASAQVCKVRSKAPKAFAEYTSSWWWIWKVSHLLWAASNRSSTARWCGGIIQFNPWCDSHATAEITVEIKIRQQSSANKAFRKSRNKYFLLDAEI